MPVAIKQIVTHMLVPPGFVIILLLAVSLFLARRRERGAAFLLLLCASLLWAVSTDPVADLVCRPLEAPFDRFPPLKGDSIVLLGGGSNGDSSDLTGEGAVVGDMMERLVTAARIQRKLDVPIVVSGGRTFDFQTPEAPIVRRYLVDLGVPQEKIIIEGKSRDTRENALFTAVLLAHRGLKSPILVTSAYHLRRSVILFERAGVKATPVAGGFLSAPSPKRGWASFLPNAGAMRRFAAGSKEWIGLTYYRYAER